jgi:hypothetical protein
MISVLQWNAEIRLGTEHRRPVIREVNGLLRRKRPNIANFRYTPCCKHGWLERRRSNEGAIVTEGDKASVEQPIDVRRKQ